jgi:hypothetical protein
MACTFSGIFFVTSVLTAQNMFNCICIDDLNVERELSIRYYTGRQGGPFSGIAEQISTNTVYKVQGIIAIGDARDFLHPKVFLIILMLTSRCRP